jgi:hypothetical protein
MTSTGKAMTRMTTQEIIKNSQELKDSDMDWKKMYAILLNSVKTNKSRIMRNDNTLFWYRIDEPGVAQMYVFNADTYKNLLRSMQGFAKAMHIAGFKKVYGETHDMNILSLIQRIGFPVDIEKIGTDEKGRQIYRGTVNV